MSSRHRSAEDLTVSGIITHASIGKAEFNLGRHDFEEIDVDIRCETGEILFSVEAENDGSNSAGTLLELTPEQAINIGNELVRAAGEERRTYSTEEE